MLMKELKDRIVVLTIAYHNLGVEQEFMQMYHEAVESYRLSKDYAEKYLGMADPIADDFRNIYYRAKDEIDKSIARKREKEIKQQDFRAKQKRESHVLKATTSPTSRRQPRRHPSTVRSSQPNMVLKKLSAA